MIETVCCMPLSLHVDEYNKPHKTIGHHSKPTDHYRDDNTFTIPHTAQFHTQSTILRYFLLFFFVDIDIIWAGDINNIAFLVFLISDNNIWSVEDMWPVCVEDGIIENFYISKHEYFRWFMSVPFCACLDVEILAQGMVDVLGNPIMAFKIFFLG